MPREKYSYAPEIFEHTRRVGEYFGLYENAVFQTRVTEVRYDETAGHWGISTHRGDRITARFVIQATGPANRPSSQASLALATLKDTLSHLPLGLRLHRWRPQRQPHWLADKRVAIIGTGATAIQCVPFLGEHAMDLYVFQRTPSSVDLRGNRPTDESWYNDLKPGWQRERRRKLRRDPGRTTRQAKIWSPTAGPTSQGVLAFHLRTESPSPEIWTWRRWRCAPRLRTSKK